jgi:hypothetical protein
VDDQGNERAYQQEMDHRRRHMKNEETSKPENNQNGEQDDEYW